MGVMLTDLATACRKSGLRIVETPGWKTRTRPGGMATRPQTIVLHHTATASAAAGNYPSLRIVRDGRPDLDGPLAQLGLGRDGTVYVIAAGRANHAGATHLTRQSNSHAIGIEVESPGTPITGAQYGAMVRLAAALAGHYGIPVDHVESHAEVAVPVGRKNDIRNPMATVRADITKAMHPASPTVTIAARTRGPFPLPRGEWFGVDDGTAKSHSGKRTADAPGVRQVQAVAGVTVDGAYGPGTAKGVAAWQAKHGRKATGRVTVDDWAAMGAAR